MLSSQKKLSSTNKSRKSNNSTPKKWGWVIVVSVIFVFAIIGLFAQLNASKAELLIMTAPHSANVKIDGKKSSNGRHKLSSGKHEVEIFEEGLETKKLEIDLQKGETKSLNIYLVGENEDFSYYLSHESELKYLQLMSDVKAQDFLNRYYQAKTIEEILPLRITHDNGRKSSTLSIDTGENCGRNYCLRIIDDNADLKKEMLNKIKEYGYNPEDYEIEYFRTDSLKEKNDDK